MGSPALPNSYNGISSPASPFLLNLTCVISKKMIDIDSLMQKNHILRFDYNSGGTAKKRGQNLGFLYTRNFGKEINVVGSFDFISSIGDFK